MSLPTCSRTTGILHWASSRRGATEIAQDFPYWSLVGPRPALSSESEQYEDWQLDRLVVRPGLTGVWQDSGRSDVSFEQYVRRDLYYIETWSVMFGLYILAKTIPAVIKAAGVVLTLPRPRGDMRQKTAVVAGAGGFIGHSLVRYLKERGYYVRDVDVKLPEHEASSADEFLLPDQRLPQNAHRPTAGMGEVYQLAASMGGIGYITGNRSDAARNNVLINSHMLERIAAWDASRR